MRCAYCALQALLQALQQALHRCDFVDSRPHWPRAGAIMPRVNSRASVVETANIRRGSLLMKAKLVMAVVVVAAVSAPLAAQAQGIIGGGQQGIAIGQRTAGPVGAA